jgi:hypothetical protein
MMKRTLITMVIFLGVLCCAATSQAYFYAFEIYDGAVKLNLNEDNSEVSMVTTEELIVGFSYDAPSEDTLLSYTLSADLDLTIFGAFTYDLTLDAEPIGVFDSITPGDFIGDGTSAMEFSGQTQISSDFGEYSLEGATLAYDVMFTPVDDEDDAYAIAINALTLSGGNTEDFLSSLLGTVTGSTGLSLSGPLTVSAELTGDIELAADHVPVPAAVWLLGSGLLSILGLRRRSVA